MKKIPIVSLKVITVLIAIVAAIILIYFPLIEGRATDLSLFDIYFDRFILYGYATSISFFVAIYNLFKLLGYIGEGKLYSSKSVVALNNIKNCAIILSVVIFIAGLYIKLFHNKEDDPTGFIVICFMIITISISVATVSAIFSKRLRDKVDLK